MRRGAWPRWDAKMLRRVQCQCRDHDIGRALSTNAVRAQSVARNNSARFPWALPVQPIAHTLNRTVLSGRWSTQPIVAVREQRAQPTIGCAFGKAHHDSGIPPQPRLPPE